MVTGFRHGYSTNDDASVTISQSAANAAATTAKDKGL